MLTIDNVHKTFFAGTVNELRALAGVSLTLAEGDFLTVIGSNGAGKSTILNAISGSLIPNTGTVRVDVRVLSATTRDLGDDTRPPATSAAPNARPGGGGAKRGGLS